MRGVIREIQMKNLLATPAIVIIAVLVTFFAGAISYAQPDEEAYALFVSGAFDEAAEAAASAGGAENLALAARAINAEAYLETDNKAARRLSKRALKYAEQAIEDNPVLVEGHLQAAISYALRGARMSPVRAFLSGAAGKARKLLDHALTLDPENAWALSSSGAWHLEVARRAGEGRFGSDPEVGFQQFAAARAAQPQNLLIAYEAALRLLAYDEPAARENGLAALHDAVTLAPSDAFERRVLMRAKVFQQAVDDGREAERAYIKAQP
jgi:hypothetical protein